MEECSPVILLLRLPPVNGTRLDSARCVYSFRGGGRDRHACAPPFITASRRGCKKVSKRAVLGGIYILCNLYIYVCYTYWVRIYSVLYTGVWNIYCIFHVRDMNDVCLTELGDDSLPPALSGKRQRDR